MDIDVIQRATAWYTLALTVWREARGEAYETREAVAGVVMERVRRGGWYGSDVTTVCTKKWQFSSLTDPRDEQLTLWPQLADLHWLECAQIADDALAGRLVSRAGSADLYHDDSLTNPPPWAKPECFVIQLGRLLFYDSMATVTSTIASAVGATTSTKEG